MKRKASFFIYLLILISSFFESSCNKSEDSDLPAGWQYSPGPLIWSPFIEAKVNGTKILTAYEFSHITWQTSQYNSIAHSISIQRFSNTPDRKPSFSITGSNINLDQITFPITFWPGPINSNHAQLKLTLSSNTEYSFNPSDTTLFSITLNGFNNGILTGTFSGQLFFKSQTIDTSVTVTNGLFNIKFN